MFYNKLIAEHYPQPPETVHSIGKKLFIEHTSPESWDGWWEIMSRWFTTTDMELTFVVNRLITFTFTRNAFGEPEITSVTIKKDNPGA